MTTKQFTECIDTLLTEGGGIENVIREACLYAVSTDYAKRKFLDEANRDFILPKIVLTAVLQQLAWQYEPIDKRDIKKVKEIKPHITFKYKG